MADISAKDVMALRQKTGCGMMECKKALVEANGDFEEAVKVLREKGLAVAAKKAGRVASEGLVDIARKAKPPSWRKSTAKPTSLLRTAPSKTL